MVIVEMDEEFGVRWRFWEWVEIIGQMEVLGSERRCCRSIAGF